MQESLSGSLIMSGFFLGQRHHLGLLSLEYLGERSLGEWCRASASASLSPDSPTHQQGGLRQASTHLCLSFLTSITGTTILNLCKVPGPKGVSVQASSLPPLWWDLPVSPPPRGRAEGHGITSRSQQRARNRLFAPLEKASSRDFIVI